MIVKNHTIVLEDTSPSELARFRQIMLGIWRQQIEDDKNTAEMLRYVKNSQIKNNATFISVFEIIECIKRKIGRVYSNISFSEFMESSMMSTPEKSDVLSYNNSQGIQKTDVVLLEWNTFKGINLIAKTFRPSIKIGKYHTNFTLSIFDNELKEIAFKFTVHDFDLYITLFELLGIEITSDAQIIIDLYLKKIKEANDNPSKLDVIYESLPQTLFGKMNDRELYKHLNLLLNDVSILEAIGTPAGLDTNEDKAILQILYAIKDREYLYIRLRDTDLLYKIYSKLHGEEVQDLLRFLTRLVAQFDETVPIDTVYFDNSYYLFRDTHIKSNWTAGKIWVNNYKDQTKIVGKLREAYNSKELDKMYPPGVQQIYIPKYYILNKSFNPLAKLNFGTKLGDLGEQIGDENTFVIALKLHNMATKQSNWDLFNVATDLLSLLSAYGALRIVLAKGAPIAARMLAGVVLAKDATHYAMLSNGTLEKWHENGYGWLANLWVTFSVTTDLASFGLPNLSKIAKEGNAVAELAETAEDAREIRRVAEEANEIVKAETGKSVSKMTEKEFEKFSKKVEKIENSKNKEKITLDVYEKQGLISKTSKEFNNTKYNIFEYSNEIVWKVDNPKFTWNNKARLWGGELEFDFNTYGIAGLGQKWTNEAFEIFENKIKSIRVEWKQLPEYPEGESLGYKQFNKIFNETYDKYEAVKSTTFYKTMSNKGFKKIKYVDPGESVIVILTKEK